MSSAEQWFNQMCDAATFQGVTDCFRNMCSELGLQDTHYEALYPALKEKLTAWKCQDLWKLLDKRYGLPEYDGQRACSNKRVCVIGAGPVGLRTAVEAALLGAKVDVVEKRRAFSRNNVLHLWPFLITDLRNLGAKRFYPKFCAGAIDHISIRILQCMLLKVCLLLGVKVYAGVEFRGLVEPSGDKGWMIDTSPSCDISQHQYDIIVGADGKKYSLPGFRTKEFRAKLAIAITVNFVNHNSTNEASIEEISGVSYIYNQSFFDNLKKKHGIDLENIVYYKDETHYFVMTAKKHSLLKKGVLVQDKNDPSELLSSSNISRKALLTYAQEAAHYSTKGRLCVDEFVINDKGVEDVALFDFTSLFAAENAARIVEREGKRLLMCLVGDSLLEPFWPTGSGCARGFLGALDAAWMMKGFGAGEDPLKLLEEREAIHLLLPQTTPQRLHKNHAAYTINPSTRYPNLSGIVPLAEVSSLYDVGTGPIKNMPRTPQLRSAEKRPPAPMAEASDRKRSKDDSVVQERLQPVSIEPAKKPRIVDTLTDTVQTSAACTPPPFTKTHSPKSKPKLRNVKSEGRSLFRPALKPKPTITFSNDSRVHKITHKKSATKLQAKGNPVTLLSHTKVTAEDSSTHKDTILNKPSTQKPVVPGSKPDLQNSPAPSESKPPMVHKCSPVVNHSFPVQSRDPSPPPREVNVLEMKASLEKKFINAGWNSSPKKEVARRSTVGTVDLSGMRVPKSASFSDLKSQQQSSSPSSIAYSKQHSDKHHKLNHQSSDKKNVDKTANEKVTSAKKQDQPKQTASQEKHSFLKWLREPVAAVVASFKHTTSGSYSPKDFPDGGSDKDEGSYHTLDKEDNSTLTLQQATPTKAATPTQQLVTSTTDEPTPMSPMETTQERAITPVQQDLPIKQVSPDQLDGLLWENEATTSSSEVPEDAIRIQSLIDRLEPSTDDSSDGGGTMMARHQAALSSNNQRKRRGSLTALHEEELSVVKVEPLWLAKVRASLSKCLERLRKGYDIVVSKTALEILHTISNNVEQFPDDDNYRRVRISSEHFSSKVWDYPCCQDFLIRAGWMEIDDFIVVPIDHQLTISLAVIEKHLDIVNNMIWSLQIELPEPQKPTVMERLRRQQRAKLSRRESYTSRVVNMATESVAQAAHHQKQRRSLHSKYRPSQSGSEREDSLSSPSPEPLPELSEGRVEEIATIKAARTAKRVWRKRLAHNIFSKPEQHWKPKLEAELYDIEQDKPSEDDYKPQPFLSSLDGPVGKGSKMPLIRRHTVGNTPRSMSSSSGRSSLSPPPSDDVTTSQSDLNSDDVFSDDVNSDHDNKESAVGQSPPRHKEDDLIKDASTVARLTWQQREKQFGDKVNKEIQDKKTDSTNDTSIDTTEQKEESPQLQFKRDELCDLPEEEDEEETCDISNEHNHLAEHRRQEEKMVLEAGSKAAEIAKSVFGK